ncbi:FAD/NAD(P)-binding domain-containing protein [Exidia glandulosa HHB12029]|uniref:FAD/NAD(P)-binding domain-containing protein n=1 Tax=Exidia glandulosa HHB12029 TaxID=1314781 RepID=A0A165M617_EXIGL|nr:FAD/NAD(P)-binding domain-containing protein [Exidia glandulosa HHB12029]
MEYLKRPSRVFEDVLDAFYYLVQFLIIFLFKPTPPRSYQPLTNPRGRIAVIGAGLTGVSSAAHCIAAGFEVVIFESKDKVGGIWADVNSTSGLQLNSLLYRFHPAVHWKHAFPHRDEILGQIRSVWTEYKLDIRTRFNTKVTSVERVKAVSTSVAEGGHARWIVNGAEDEIFDAVIATIGTCGAPRKIHFPGSERFTHGQVLHSAELDDAELKDKRVVVIGGGASGVEAVELAISKGAKDCVIVARDDKWVIPRNIVFDTMISMQPFGREMPLSFIPEWVLRTFHYRGVRELAPRDKGIFEGTPVVNDEFLGHVRKGRCRYVRGDGKTLTENGVLIGVKAKAQKKKDEDENRSPSPEHKKHAGDTDRDEGEEELAADVVVLATGFERPSVDFLPHDLFPDDYARPNMYLQNFSTEDWSVLLTNSSYVSGIGTVGHFHIGIYTRILLTLLMDRTVRPTPRDMKLWVDNLRFVKKGAKGGALGFFTYMELTLWLVMFHVLRPDRLPWMFFILNGWTFGRSLARS